MTILREKGCYLMIYEFDNKLSYIVGLDKEPEKAYADYVQHLHEIRMMAERVGDEYGLFSQKQTFKIQGTPYLEAIIMLAYVRKKVVLWLRKDDELLISINTELQEDSYPTIDDFIYEINTCVETYSKSTNEKAKLGAKQAEEMADVFMILKEQFGYE